MQLSESDLEAFAAHCREQFDDPEPPSRRAVQLRIVEPLLERLGWDLRGEDVVPDVDLAGWHVDYLLQVDGVPAIAVAAVDPVTDLESGPAAAAADALGERGVDWALVTDGRRFVLLARAGGRRHSGTLTLADLADGRDALARYARSAARERLEAARRDRTEAAGRLAERREAAIEAVADALVEVAGPALEAEARAAAEALVDELAPADRTAHGRVDGQVSADESERAAGDRERSPADDGPGDGPPASEESSAAGGPTADAGSAAGEGRPGREPASGADADAVSPDTARVDSGLDHPDPGRADGARDGGAGTGSERDHGDPDGDAPTSDPGRAPPSAGSGEYVVRFFGGNASVGAVGTDHPGSTLAGAVEFLAERHGLAESITLPWGGEPGRAIVTAAPEHPDGTPMEYYRAVEGGVCVWTDVDVASAKEAIGDLAEASGLRAMFQGDW